MLPESSEEGDLFLIDLDEALAGLGKQRLAGNMSAKYVLDRSCHSSIRKIHKVIDARVQEALELTEVEAAPKAKATPVFSFFRTIRLH